MKKRRLSIALLFVSILLLSFTPLSVNADITEATGHSFTEEYWAIEYDVLNMDMTHDYSPGDFADDYDESTTVDPFPLHNASAKYTIDYVNVGGVQSLYMAMTDFSASRLAADSYGLAPYQTLLQHFRTPTGKRVFVENTFTGLVAYQDNLTHGDPGVPDGFDEVYFGNSISAKRFRHVFNLFLESKGVYLFSEDIPPSVTSNIVTKVEEDGVTEYRFGMTYHNMTTFWHGIDDSVSLDESLSSAIDILYEVKAISLFESLEFSYIMRVEQTEDGPTLVTTTTEYDIGPVTDLYIIGDSSDDTSFFGGNRYNWMSVWGDTPRSISRYNTSISISARLSGNATTPGFGLGVANYAKMIVLESGATRTFVNQAGRIPAVNETIGELSYRLDDDRAFDIDFASKPNYTLAGDVEENMREAPIKVYPHSALNAQITRPGMLAGRFLYNTLREVVTTAVGSELGDFNITSSAMDLFYTINFPTWGGKAIVQDPTFTAYSVPESIRTNKIDGFAIIPLVLAGMGMAYLLVVKSRKSKID